jgi:uncharacterized membrane protein
MPFCSQCGNQVGAEDAFCAHCGARQPGAPAPFSTPPRPVFQQTVPDPAFPAAVLPTDPLANIPPRTFALLCYIPVLGWIPAVVVLGMKRFRGDFKMRFHAFQGLYIFAAWLIVEWAIHPLFENMRHVFRVDSILSTLLMFVWIFMLVKTSQGEIYELPIVGELAQRSAREKP